MSAKTAGGHDIKKRTEENVALHDHNADETDSEDEEQNVQNPMIMNGRDHFFHGKGARRREKHIDRPLRCGTVHKEDGEEENRCDNKDHERTMDMDYVVNDGDSDRSALDDDDNDDRMQEEEEERTGADATLHGVQYEEEEDDGDVGGEYDEEGEDGILCYPIVNNPRNQVCVCVCVCMCMYTTQKNLYAICRV